MLTDFFIKRPVLSLVISVMILLLGAQAFFETQVRQYPELENSVINITTAYPGASAELIQGFISTPIQQAVSSTAGIDRGSRITLRDSRKWFSDQGDYAGHDAARC